ncbi:hypothetical protein V1505DRAFT_363272 [Lipomyces doorenjongii]
MTRCLALTSCLALTTASGDQGADCRSRRTEATGVTRGGTSPGSLTQLCPVYSSRVINVLHIQHEDLFEGSLKA